MAEGATVGRINVRVAPDTSKFRQELSAKLKQIEKSLEASVQIDVDLDNAGINQKFRAMMTQLRAQAAGGIDINTNIDSDGFKRGISSQIQKFTKDLDGLSKSADEASSAFMSVGRTGLIVGAVAAAAAPAVGLVAGLMAGLPSLIGAFGAGAGAVALGLDGIKKSAESLAPDLDALKASVSGVFEQRLTPIFDQLKGIFPVLETGMASVANGLSDIFQGVTDAITQGGGIGQLQSILGNVGSFFSGLAPIVQSFTGSFLTLADAGSKAFGQLLTPLQAFSTQFSEMINRVTANGVFDGAIQGLSSVLGSVLNLFSGLFESGLTAMGQLGGPLTTLINGLGDAFLAAMPALTAFSGLIANVGGSLLSALAPAITAITPALSQFATTFGTLISTNIGSLAPVFTQIATALGTGLTTALNQIAPLLPGLMNSFSQLASVFAGQLATVLPTVATAFGTLAGAMLQIAPTVLQSLADAFMQLSPQLPSIAGLIPSIANAFTTFVQAVTPLVPQIVQLATNAVTLAPALVGIAPVVLQIVAAMLQLTTTITSAGAAVVEFAGKAVSEVAALPGKVIGALGDVGSTLFNSGKALIQGFIDGIKSMVSTVTSTIGNLMSAARDFFPFSPAKQGAFSGSGWVKNSGIAIGQGLADGIRSQYDNVSDATKKMAQTAAEGLKPPGDSSGDWASYMQKATDIGANFAKANIDQLQSDLNIGGGALTSIAGQALDWGVEKLGNSYTFNVSNMDEALRAQKTADNKAALQYTGR